MYKVWVSIGNYFGFSSRLLKAQNDYLKQLAKDLEEDWNNLSFIKGDKYDKRC
jgi:cell division protein FtsL